MRSELPTGTVTLLFTDIEGSTRLLDELGANAYGALLAEHHRVCREAWLAHDGVEFGTAGDAFFVAFARPSDALAATAAAQEGLAGLGVWVRMGVHTGEVELGETGYLGMEVQRAARIAASGHGGQVLVSAATAALVEVPLTDLGEHRFKDLGAPGRVFQIGNGKFPPLKSLHRTNLPVPATPFLGRKEELASVAGMIAEPDTRLVSLTGPGGTGKTRLALQAAAEASDGFPDGVYWTPLAPLRDPGLVLTEVAVAVGVSEREGDSALDDLAEGLASKQLLVFLDNIEHLLPEAAEHISGLVAACPTVTVVVTSRERLALPGERVFAVPPMSETDAEALFRRRAADAGVLIDDSAELRTLCARLDNLPLALELAAPRMVVFSPAQLLDRLSQRLDLLKGGRGTDTRQETLRATIAWSHDMLDPNEQQLFRRLSVFVGGFTYDSAEQVAGAEPDTLQSLLDKSLLRRRDAPTGPRFWMLETIREYATEQLAAASETDGLRHHHLGHYAGTAADCYDETWGGHDDLERIDAERDNLRLALDFALETDPELALDLATHLAPSWGERGEYRHGREKLAAALALAPDISLRSRASAVLELHDLATLQRDAEAAETLALQALDLSRTLGDRVGEGRALTHLGWHAYRRADPDTARHLFDSAVDALGAPGSEVWQLRALEGITLVLSTRGNHAEALALLREIVARTRSKGSESSLARYLGNLGELERAAGQTEQARRSLEESIALFRQRSRSRGLTYSLHSLGCVLRASAPDEALAAFSESLQLARDMDDLSLVAYCLDGAAELFARRGKAAHAASLLGAAATIRAQIGDGRTPLETAESEAAEAPCREALTPEAFTAAWEQGAALDAHTAANWALEAWEQAGQSLR